MKFLKILQYVLIFVIVILYIILDFSSNDYDKSIILLNRVIKIFGIIWILYVGLIKISNTKPNENPNTIILENYKKLRNSKLFLALSNILLLVPFFILLYEIINYRNVEFISKNDVELFESNGVGNVEKIGDIPGNKLISFRIRIGLKYFSFKNPFNENHTSLPPIEIPSFLKQKNIERIKLIEDRDFELLK